MKKAILLFLLLPMLALQMLSAKETTRVVMRMQVRCTISKPGMFAEYAERYLGVKDAVSNSSTEYEMKGIRLYEQGKEPEIKETAIDTTILFNIKCLGEEALMATSMPKMAERAAKQIYQLREARTALITGDMSTLPDGEALKAMLHRIDKEEQKLVELFVGKRISYTFYKDIVITPDEKDKTNEIVSRFSKRIGVVDADDMIGEPIYITLTGKRVKAPELTPKQLKKVYDWEHVKGNAEITVTYKNNAEAKLYLDEVKQFGADIPIL